MKALRSQMNPHFIFNSLNSIHKYIWESRTEDASEYLTKFSTLIRKILDVSENKTVSLTREIELLKLYTELEHRRSNDKFSYDITISSDVEADLIMVPPLIFQPYVENAIWHGLQPKMGKGFLAISFIRTGNTLKAVIDDNGIGRKQARNIKASKKMTHHSKGLDITAERIQLLSASGKKPSVEIIDKENADGTAAGTTVIILLPLYT